jgi:hypothetical protein
VMGFNVGGIVGDSGAEGAGGLGGFALGQQVQATLGEQVGRGLVGCVHGNSEDKPPADPCGGASHLRCGQPWGVAFRGLKF